MRPTSQRRAHVHALAFAAAAALTALLGSASPCHAGGWVHVPESVQVRGPQLVLGEIASFDGLSAQLESQLAALAFGPSPEPSRARTLLGASVRSAVHSIDATLRVEVPERIAVRRAAVRLTRDVLQQRVERAIRHVMPWPEGSVTLERWSLPSELTAPPECDRLWVRFAPGERFLGRTSAELELTDPEHPERPGVRASASVQIGVRLPVAVAARNLRRGETLGAGAFVMRERDLQHIPSGAIADPHAALGQKLAAAVREGSALQRAHLGADPVVRRGEKLRVDATQGGLELTLEAVALEHGRTDQVIRARNPDTRRELLVLVTGPHEGRLAAAAGPRR